MMLWLYQSVSFFLMLAAMYQVGFFSGIAFMLLSLGAFFPGYNAIATLLYVSGLRKLTSFAVQLGLCWALLFLASLLELSITWRETTVASAPWVGIGLLIGAWNGFTRPPAADEIAEVNAS